MNSLNSYLPKIKNWQKSKYKLALLVIISLAVLVRFWHLQSLFHWTLDEEYWSYVAFNVATGRHFPLIGGPIGGTGVYLGPLFVWLMGIVFLLVGSNPIWIATMVSVIGVLTTGLIYILFNKYIEKNPAILVSALYGSSTLVTIYDRKYWNASLAPILSLFSLYLLYSLRKNPTFKNIVILACVVSLAVNAHMTGLALVIFGLIGIIVSRIPAKLIVIYMLTILVLHTPLILFDIRHDFTNSRSVVSLITGQKSLQPEIQQETDVVLDNGVDKLIVGGFARLLYVPARDISNELTLCKPMASSRTPSTYIYYGFTLIILGYSLFQLKDKNLPAILLWTNILLVVTYKLLSPDSFYPGLLSDYYLLPSFIAFLLLASQLFIKVYKWFPQVVIGVITLIIVSNLHTTLQLVHSHSYQQKYQTVRSSLDMVRDRAFTLKVVGHECQIYGYRYLYTWLGREPVASYLDGSFGWLYEDSLPQEDPEVEVVIDADSARIEVNEIDTPLEKTS